MTKEEMIKAIYEKIADKTLSFGCEIKLKDYIENKRIILGKDISFNEFRVSFTLDNKEKWFKINDIEEIIGHPVMIGDVLDYWEETTLDSYIDMQEDYSIEKCEEFRDKDRNKIVKKWNYFRNPIEEQSLDCIEYIYNLIK